RHVRAPLRRRLLLHGRAGRAGPAVPDDRDDPLLVDARRALPRAPRHEPVDVHDVPRLMMAARGDLLDGLTSHREVSPAASAALLTLAGRILDRNQSVRPATDEYVVEGIATSAAALEVAQLSSARRIVGIGSGLGFPGLVLAAMLPCTTFVLVERE